MTLSNLVMPAEWQPHSKTWMAWPTSGYTLGETEQDCHEARSTWAAVANAIVRFERVSMLCQTEDLAIARTYLDERVELIEAALDDAWMRDIGPTFVRNRESGELIAANWIFNGWGAQSWASWANDAKVARFIGEHEGTSVEDSWLVNEGGGIHVNGAGTVLLTETVQLGEGRNAGSSKDAVEQKIHRILGTARASWIKR